MVKIDNFLNITVLFWIALWCINFLGAGTDIALLGGIILVIIFFIKNVKVSQRYIYISFLLLIFGLFYSIILNYHENLSMARGLREVVLPVVLYSVGYLVSKNDTSRSELLTAVIIVSSFSLFLYGILNFIFHINIYGDVSINNRLIYDIWSGNLIQATAQGSKLILITSLIVPIYLNPRSFKKSVKLVIVVSAFLSFWATLVMANRSLFIIFLLVLVTTVLYSMYLDGKRVSKIILHLVSFFIISLSIFLIYQNNIFGINDIIETSNLAMRLNIATQDSLASNSRFSAWEITLKNLGNFPFGGSNAPISISSPHNLWLDIAYTTGAIPFILFIIITAIYIRYFHNILNLNIKKSFKLLFYSFNAALFANLLIEPILSGHYYLFMIFILSLGVWCGFLEKMKLKGFRVSDNG